MQHLVPSSILLARVGSHDIANNRYTHIHNGILTFAGGIHGRIGREGIHFLVVCPGGEIGVEGCGALVAECEDVICVMALEEGWRSGLKFGSGSRALSWGVGSVLGSFESGGFRCSGYIKRAPVIRWGLGAC